MKRPAAGFATRRPEEPCANSASTVLWEPGRATAPATRQAERSYLGLEPALRNRCSPTIIHGEPPMIRPPARSMRRSRQAGRSSVLTPRQLGLAFVISWAFLGACWYVLDGESVAASVLWGGGL